MTLAVGHREGDVVVLGRELMTGSRSRYRSALAGVAVTRDLADAAALEATTSSGVPSRHYPIAAHCLNINDINYARVSDRRKGGRMALAQKYYVRCSAQSYIAKHTPESASIE
jgi:hypothetical protein